MTPILSQIISTILLTVIFPIYIIYILWRNQWKVLHSISDSWYILKSKGKSEEILFTLWCYITGLLLLLQYPNSFLFFPAGMGLFWVGTQTQFRDNETPIKETIHYLGAILTILLSLIGLLLNGIWLPLVIFSPSAYLIQQWGIKNGIWWVEIIAFITIIGGLWSL